MPVQHMIAFVPVDHLVPFETDWTSWTGWDVTHYYATPEGEPKDLLHGVLCSCIKAFENQHIAVVLLHDDCQELTARMCLNQHDRTDDLPMHCWMDTGAVQGAFGAHSDYVNDLLWKHWWSPDPDGGMSIRCP